MKRLSIVALAVVCVFLLYKLSYPTYSCRYRMTVSVEVDGRLHSSSSVIEYRISKQMQFLPTVNPAISRAQGEAIFVDLGGQRSLIALLHSGVYAEDGNFPLRIVPAHFRLDTDSKLATLPGLRGKWELSEKDLPALATFSDPNNSATLKIVRPDQLEQVFGQGVRWRGITIEMTTDPVTRGLETHLPFLTSQKEMLLRAYTNPWKFIPNYTAFVST